MAFKQTYTDEEIKTLLDWMDTKPSGRVDVGQGIVVEDLARYVQNARRTIENRHENSAFGGYIDVAFRIKAKYEADQSASSAG